jgi:hypothetical protein
MVSVRANKIQSPRDSESWEWFFVFSADRKGRIPPIKKKYLELFESVDNTEGINFIGKINGVVYEGFTFDSRSRVLLGDLRGLAPEFVWDSYLYHREIPDGLETYVANCFKE